MLKFALVPTAEYKKRIRKRRRIRREKNKDDASIDSNKKKNKSYVKDKTALKERAIEDKLRKKRNREKEKILSKKQFDTRNLGSVSTTAPTVKQSRLQKVAPEIPQLLI